MWTDGCGTGRMDSQMTLLLEIRPPSASATCAGAVFVMETSHSTRPTLSANLNPLAAVRQLQHSESKYRILIHFGVITTKRVMF